MSVALCVRARVRACLSIPQSLLGNGSQKIPLFFWQRLGKNNLSLLGNGSVETLLW
jgi:hypothetical protein